MNLGNALRALGERESNPAHLEEAVAAYRLALQEDTRDRMPLEWAAIQSGLGTALRILGEQESGAARLEEALTAYSTALEEQTRDRVPLDWARTQLNMGLGLVALGEREHSADRLNEALTCFQQAMPTLAAVGLTDESKTADRMIGRLKDELAKSTATPGQSAKPGG